MTAAGLKSGFEKHLHSPTPPDVTVSEPNIILVASGAFSVLYCWDEAAPLCICKVMEGCQGSRIQANDGTTRSY